MQHVLPSARVFSFNVVRGVSSNDNDCAFISRRVMHSLIRGILLLGLSCYMLVHGSISFRGEWDRIPKKCACMEISDRRQHCFDQNFLSAYINLIFISAGCIYFDKLQLVSSSCVNSLLWIWHHPREWCHGIPHMSKPFLRSLLNRRTRNRTRGVRNGVIRSHMMIV